MKPTFYSLLMIVRHNTMSLLTRDSVYLSKLYDWSDRVCERRTERYTGL